MRDLSFRGILSRNTQKLGPDVEDFKCLAVATRCGWDSRAPKNRKQYHYPFFRASLVRDLLRSRSNREQSAGGFVLSAGLLESML
jgi:hypothetical protein